MARILIVGGGCRGRALAAAALADGHAVRVSTRSESGRGPIESIGAECWLGTPDRLATLRGALEGVTIACWMLGSCTGTERTIEELYGERLPAFMVQAIDTTIRGVLYEARGTTTPARLLKDGERTVRRLGELNAMPVAILDADPADPQAWLLQARAAIAALLDGG